MPEIDDDKIELGLARRRQSHCRIFRHGEPQRHRHRRQVRATGGRERGRTVVYAGTGLRGYGKLIIVKHNSTYLSAYAHNREILVKEGQQVAKGQKISEMGDTDADQVKLHFEIRRLGKPVDPAKYLPPA